MIAAFALMNVFGMPSILYGIASVGLEDLQVVKGH